MNYYKYFFLLLFSLIFYGCTQTADEEQKSDEELKIIAKELAINFMIIDTHVDVPYRLKQKWEDISEKTEEGHFDYPRAVVGGLNVPFMSIYVSAKYEETGGGKELADKLIDMVEAIAKWKKSASELYVQLNRPPTPEEIAAELKILPRKVKVIKQAIRAMSIRQDSSWPEAADSVEMLLADDEHTPEKELFNEYETQKLNDLLDCISEREAEILRRRYGLDAGTCQTLGEIASIMGISRERVRQVERNALKRLQFSLTSGKDPKERKK